MKYIILIFFTTITLSESNYKEPNFILLYSQKNIEVRQYEEYVVAKTRVSSDYGRELENNMFRTLASYIF